MARATTRLIRSLSRKIGYDLRRLQKTKIHDFDDAGSRDVGSGFDAFEAQLPRVVSNFDIVLRTAARKDMDSPARRRFIDASKKELASACLKSLVASANVAAKACPGTEIALTVIDDRSDPDALDVFRDILSGAAFRATLTALPPEIVGNGPSVRWSYAYGRDRAKDVVYFVEDDFLHDLPAVSATIQSYGMIAAAYGRDVVLVPVDAPEDYRHVRPSQVMLGNDRHWRRTWTSTFTSVTTVGLLKKYWERYSALGDYGVVPDVAEHNTIDLIYREVPCLTPMPSLALHMQMLEHLSPYIDWGEWWRRHSDAPIRPHNLG